MDERENIPVLALNGGNESRNTTDCTNYNKMMEYARLRSLVPSVASKSRVSKIQVIEEAIKYIALLQQALRTESDSTVQEVTQDNPTRTTQIRPKTTRVKRQRIASYMIQDQRPKTRPKYTKSTNKKRTRFIRI